MINATATGNKFNQHNLISWSYRSLGKVALNQTNKKQKKHVFNPKTIDCIFIVVSFTTNSGKLYPPQNKIAVIQLNNTIDEYSPRKKKTKGTDECSVKNPATNSDSYKIYLISLWLDLALDPLHLKMKGGFKKAESSLEK